MWGDTQKGRRGCNVLGTKPPMPPPNWRYSTPSVRYQSYIDIHHEPGSQIYLINPSNTETIQTVPSNFKKGRIITVATAEIG